MHRAAAAGALRASCFRGVQLHAGSCHAFSGATLLIHEGSSCEEIFRRRYSSHEATASSATELAGLSVPSTRDQDDARGPLVAYESLISSGQLRQDARQECTVKELERLYRDLIAQKAHASKSGSGLTLIDASSERHGHQSWWKSIFSEQSKDSATRQTSSRQVKGLYMYGGVGCGKTMLMDMFASSVPRDLKVCMNDDLFMS